MRIKLVNLILVLLFCIPLTGVTSDFHQFIEQLLDLDLEYQKEKNDLELIKAEHKMENSLNWGEINFSYQKYKNDITRDEQDRSNEFIKIAEDDDRMQLEYTKSFFQTDFDDVLDKLTIRNDLFSESHKFNIIKLQQQNQILDDLIEWYELKEELKLLKKIRKIEEAEIVVLEKLTTDNIIGSQEYIKKLKILLDIEDDIIDNEEEIELFERKYQISISTFILKMDSYIKTANTEFIEADFEVSVDSIITKLTKQSSRLSRSHKWKNIFAYLPQTTFSLSWNNRETYQIWDKTEVNGASSFDREIEENFPQAEVEFTIPLNLISNVTAKNKYLKAIYSEQKIDSQELQEAYSQFGKSVISDYNKQKKRLEIHNNIHTLAKKEYDNILFQFNIDASLLGLSPQIELDNSKYEYEKIKLDYQIAKLKFYQIIFIIENWENKW